MPDGNENRPALLYKYIIMKATIKKDFLIRDIAGEHVLIGCGEQIDFSKMLILNDTASCLISRLQQKNCATSEELAQHLTCEYNVTYGEALTDAEELLRQLAAWGVVCLD